MTRTVHMTVRARFLLAAGKGCQKGDAIYFAPVCVTTGPDPDGCFAGFADEPKDAADPDRRLWVRFLHPVAAAEGDFLSMPKVQPWEML